MIAVRPTPRPVQCRGSLNTLGRTLQTVGIVSPGAMGSAVGDSLSRGGAHVVATVAGRSERTAQLAANAAIELVPDLSTVVGRSDYVLSIVPPEAARAVAIDLRATAVAESARPLFVDLNAIAPSTARELEEIVAAGGCDLVDGSISGLPPWKPCTTRFYLSGPRAAEVGRLAFAGVETIVVGAEVGAASAVKMSTASVYKGTTAVLTQALLAADANGILEHVLADLREGAPELVERAGRRLASAAAKSGRYVGEMHEIAAAQTTVGLTPALFEGMAEVYASLATTDAAKRAPEDIPRDAPLRDVLDEMR
jgi:3-hydroxyisobutyrate dehydrogenase-like beta-hydroxyacid dehydrogenase